MKHPTTSFLAHAHRNLRSCLSVFRHLAIAWHSDRCGDLLLARSNSSSTSTSGGTYQASLDASHVVCHIDGMDCTCCEDKLRRVMESFMGLSNIKIALLHARLEFDMCQNTCELADVLVTVRRETGLLLTHLDFENTAINFYLLGHKFESLATAIVETEGLVSVQSLNKTTARITYNPKRIRIRDVLGKALGQRINVVPPPGSYIASHPLKRSVLCLALATICTIPIAILSYGFAELSESKAVASACFTLASMVQLVAVMEFYRPALRSLIMNQVFELDMLIVLSTSVAYLYSAVEFILIMTGRLNAKGSSGFFATSSMLITFVLLGRLIGKYTLMMAVEKVSAPFLPGETVALATAEGTYVETIDSALLHFEDYFQAAPNSRIPTDGVIVCGNSNVDESMLTGEHTPVLKTIGDEVTAGTFNRNGTLIVKLTRLPGRNSLTDIAEQLAQANSIKPKIQSLANQAGRWFTPVILSIAAVAFFVWLIVEVKVKQQTGWIALGTAVTYPIAVLAVSCPCAVVLAGPLVLAITGTVAARTGVIIRTSEAIEQCPKVTDVVFDKTGTLTLPDLEVVREHCFTNTVFVTQLVLALTDGVEHPMSRSLHRHLAKQAALDRFEVQDISVIPGYGISGTFGGVEVKVGSADWLGYTIDDDLLATTESIACVTFASEVVAIYGLLARLRPEAYGLITSLKARSLAVHLLSGDRKVAVESCAKSLGIDMAHVRSQCSPIEKQTYVHSLSTVSCSDSACLETQTGHRHHHYHHGHHRHHSRPTVMFIGDGTNDVLARATAQVGVQVGKISEVFSSSAPVTLVGSLTGVLDLLDLSKAAYRRIVFNFVWAAIYNLFAISLAAGVAVKGMIPPRYAGLGELVSILPVVLVGASMVFAGRGMRDSPSAEEK